MAIATTQVGMLLKPVGPTCNLRCDYCYYRRVMECVYADSPPHRFSPELVERIISQGLDYGHPAAQFSWQGGEPMLAGRDFYENVVRLQKSKASPDQTVSNALQTNGTLLDDEWCEFLKANNWLVGISMDGPPDITDRHRRFPDGRPASGAILAGLRLLQKHGVDYNVLAVVSPANARRAADVYAYFRDLGISWMQFIPSVERAEDGSVDPGALPPRARLEEPDAPAAEDLVPGRLLADHSVVGETFGRFLCDLWDAWIADEGPGKVFVRDFEAMLSVYAGRPLPLCIWAPTCAWQLLVEHNGDIYPCDHHAYDNWRLGNLLEQDIGELIASPLAGEFEARKRRYARQCRECPWLALCHGGCPKHRMAQDSEGVPVDLLCDGYRMLFEHSRAEAESIVERLLGVRAVDPARFNPYLKGEASTSASPAARKRGSAGKQSRKKQPTPRKAGRVSRNAPCPCGSGKKYKHCCGRGRG